MPSGAPRCTRVTGRSASRSRRRCSGASPVRTTPRSTRRHGRGVSGAPASAAIASAAASACWVASPPCLIGPAWHRRRRRRRLAETARARRRRGSHRRPPGGRRSSGPPSARARSPRRRPAGGRRGSAAHRRRRLRPSCRPRSRFRLVQQAGERVPGVGPNMSSGRGSGVTIVELRPFGQLVRGEQRELVQRQRPAVAGRQREEDALAAARSAPSTAPALTGRGTSSRREAVDRARARGDDQAVVVEAPPSLVRTPWAATSTARRAPGGTGRRGRRAGSETVGPPRR